MADIKSILLPDGTEYTIRDDSKLPLTGGNMTGTVYNDGGEFWSRNANDQTQYVRMGYADILYSKTWDGTNTSLKTVLQNLVGTQSSVNNGKSFISISDRSTSDITRTGTGITNVCATANFIGHDNGYTPTFFVAMWAQLKTNTNTSSLVMKRGDGTQVLVATTNATSPRLIFNAGFCNMPVSNTNMLSIGITGQNSSTTATVPAYNTYGILAIEL